MGSRTDKVVLANVEHWHDEGPPAIDDFVSLSIVHKPKITWSETWSLQAACGAFPSNPVLVERKMINWRNVRKCQRLACYGEKR